MATLFISCAELSGDLHGSLLARKLKELSPDLKLSGIGGEKLKEASVDVLMDTSSWGVIGGTEVLKIIPMLYKRLKELKSILQNMKPDGVVLIDYPGFHMRLAKVCKELGLKVFYYIPPMLWGRKGRRGEKLAKVCDVVFPIFPEEEKLYREQGARAVFVGHPLRDELSVEKSVQDIRSDFDVSGFSPVIGLLPGSRLQEVRALFPPMLGAAEKIKAEIPDACFLTACASHYVLPALKQCASPLTEKGFPVKLIEGKTYEVMKCCDFLMCASGTATLEASLIGTPMVILYKVSKLTAYLAQKLVLREVIIGLPNIVSGKRIVPELLQVEVNPDAVSRTVLSYLKDERKLMDMRENLAKISLLLGKGGAAKNAAAFILKELSLEMA